MKPRAESSATAGAAHVETRRWSAGLLVLPFALLFAAFTLYPIGQSLLMSFTQTYGPGTSRFVGMRNFIDLASDPSFQLAVRNTCVFTVGAVAVQVPLAFVLALVLNRQGLRGRAFYRWLFYSPQTFGVVFVGILASVVFAKQTGLMNRGLGWLLGPEFLDFPWLERHVMAAMIIANTWLWAGNSMVFFLAALQNIDRSVHEASVMDGASAWHRLRVVILPAVHPVLSFVILIAIIGSLQVFELPFILFGQEGGGPDDRGLTVVMYLYQNGFERSDLGYASAIGWLLAIGLVLVAIGHQRIFTRNEA